MEREGQKTGEVDCQALALLADFFSSLSTVGCDMLNQHRPLHRSNNSCLEELHAEAHEPPDLGDI